MLWVGLSGGIGSGKSTVSARLAEHGAVVIDADRLAREVVAPGTPGLAAIAERFGQRVIGADGALDRPALGQVVFADPQARRDLEAITHPLIAVRTKELLEAAPQHAVVVHDIPLLVELDRAGDYALTVIVDVPEEVRLRRLVELRGMDEDEARRRIGSQAGDEQRRLAADVLLDNSGSIEDLTAAVDALWRERLVPFEDNLRHGRHSRRPERLTVVQPDPDWASRAERLLARLRHTLGDEVLRADHIGSTSVPGLPAKDVIDLQVVVADRTFLQDAAVRERLARVGLVVAGENVDHVHGGEGGSGSGSDSAGTDAGTIAKTMIASADPARVLHCHVREEGSPSWRLALLFRDWMRDQPGERDAYARLKAEHVASGISSTDYAEAKEPWFAAAFARAEEWAVATGWSPRP